MPSTHTSSKDVALYRGHTRRIATPLLPVEMPSRFAVTVYDENGQVLSFRPFIDGVWQSLRLLRFDAGETLDDNLAAAFALAPGFCHMMTPYTVAEDRKLLLCNGGELLATIEVTGSIDPAILAEWEDDDD